MGDLVSCVCITRGFPEHVEFTIRCFEQQTYPDKELVVVHDGSASEEVVATFEKAGARVFGMPDVPLGMLRNKSVEESRGKYVAQWDDDDFSVPDRIEFQLAALQAKKANACVPPSSDAKVSSNALRVGLPLRE
jgi:glycosyltransferase involved in cell wall biosynthesis